MEAIAFKTIIENKNIVKIPEIYNEFIAKSNKKIKVIILQEDYDEDTLWSSASAKNFLDGYDEKDSIYDKI